MPGLPAHHEDTAQPVARPLEEAADLGCPARGQRAARRSWTVAAGASAPRRRLWSLGDPAAIEVVADYAMGDSTRAGDGCSTSSRARAASAVHVAARRHPMIYGLIVKSGSARASTRSTTIGGMS